MVCSPAFVPCPYWGFILCKWLTESELRAAGSDVGGLTTTAERSADGKTYVINGEKKWVTQGLWATHALIGARTGPAGPKGLSVFIVDLSTKGLSKRKLENSGVSSSGKSIQQYASGERARAHTDASIRFRLLRP
jgi:alkylation response protein AidB-like acyl-CoA dehydrogenase